MSKLQAVKANEIVLSAVGLALGEAVFKGVLTKDQLDAISNRASEIANALNTGKIVAVKKAGEISIEDPTKEDWEVIASDPDEFPMLTATKKTLDV